MEDRYRIDHFDKKTDKPPTLTELEKKRIRETIKMVPDSWHRIVDVGCGDGRVSAPLIEQGRNVVGIDWSGQSIKHFPGNHLEFDIRQLWPFNDKFDGAICCEVLEHLLPEEMDKIIINLKTYTKKGFLISVPAREPIRSNRVICPECGQEYHIWGHTRRFNSTKDLDQLVGWRANERFFIDGEGRTASELLSIWQRSLGFYSFEESTVCPYCGKSLKRPGPWSPWSILGNKVLAALQKLSAPLRPKGGWFVCRYNQVRM
jgi:SAM-dependent methyltransferase